MTSFEIHFGWEKVGNETPLGGKITLHEINRPSLIAPGSMKLWIIPTAPSLIAQSQWAISRRPERMRNVIKLKNAY